MNVLQKVYGLLQIICRLIVNIIHYIGNRFNCLLSVIKCIVLMKKSAGLTTAMDLREVYPDKGMLSCISFHHSVDESYDLTIIVPAFNAGNYIIRCLESILDQVTNYCYEVIIVDDGSTDHTVKIVEGYKSNNQLRLIRQENAGQSVARNNGISHALGRYLMFVDADDVLLPGAIESLMRAAVETKSDIVEGSHVRFYGDISDEMIRESKGKNHIESNSKNPRFVLSTYGYSWAKVYKRELWVSLRFPEGYIFEDVITKFILRRKANQVAFISDVVYGYRQNNQSSSHGSNQLKKLDSIWVLPRIFELCKYEKAPRDDVFYLLSLNHIGLLNYITTRYHREEVKLACFTEMRKQLLSIQDSRPKHMPLMFRFLDKSILDDKIEAWKYIAGTIHKYHMLKKWREIN